MTDNDISSTEAPQERRPLFLVTNDDSVDAPGLAHLINCARRFGDVIAIAPSEPKSGQSSAFSAGPLRFALHHHQGETPVYSVNGTPVDCVKLGLHTIMPRRPDFLLAGVNHGSNAGNCVIYSGTMGAVLEGCMEGIPSVGFSLTHHSWAADFVPLLPWVKDIIGRVVEEGLPTNVCLNVNFPARCKILGLKTTRAARGYWTDEYLAYDDPAGRPFYMLAGKFVNNEPDADDTDEYWLARQYATVVPVTPDMTAHAAIASTARLLDFGETHNPATNGAQ